MIGVEPLENFHSFSWESGNVFQENIPNKPQFLDLAEHDQSSQHQTRSNPFKPGEFQQLETDEHRAESVNKMTHPSGLSSLELLNSYGNGLRRLKSNQFQIVSAKQRSTQKQSTEEIIRAASARYVQFSDLRYDDFSIMMHPFGYALSGFSKEEMKDVELVHLLLAAAEKAGYQQFERASKLLSYCELTASPNGNAVELIVFCFAEALRERIEKETGRVTAKKLDRAKGKNKSDHGLNLNTSSTFARLYQRLPFLQATHFAGVQTLLDNVGSPGKLHLIDLQIRTGVQWTVLMQALVEQEKYPIELLKITAVAVESSREKIEETGLRLKTTAKSMNLPFSFHAVYVPDMTEIKESLFKIEDDEAIAVYCPLILRTMETRLLGESDEGDKKSQPINHGGHRSGSESQLARVR